MNKNEILLQPSFFYHVYNRAVGDEKLFYSEANYLYFLKKYQEYINPIADTYTYCLMPNHFHFLIKIKSEDEIKEVLIKKDNDHKLDETAITLYISKQFSNFFNGYSQAINKQQYRRGTLFSRAFKRKQIDSLDYLRNLALYIHRNPVNHGFSKRITDWKYSSYLSIVLNKGLSLKREEVIAWFNDLDNLKNTHEGSNQSNLVNLEWD